MADDVPDSMEAQLQSSQLTGLNSTYLESLYQRYLEDPASVEPSWRDYFCALVNGQAQTEVDHQAIVASFKQMAQQPKVAQAAAGSTDGYKLAAVMDLIYAYRTVGHQMATIDPLKRLVRPKPIDLDPGYHGLTDADLDTEFAVKAVRCECQPKKLRDIIAHLEQVYCGNIGVEYMHITDLTEKKWVRDRLEDMQGVTLSTDCKKHLLDRLIAADGLEKYLGMKYVGQKRFSLEGGDGLIPLLDDLVHNACAQGIKELVMGMAHRGRLNVLVNIMGKSPEELFGEFEGKHDQALLSGDVKYHNGFSSDIKREGGLMHMALAFNPSHLEIVAPVAEGSVRARQTRRDDETRDQVLAIQMHGDCAFSGQGVVMETLNMSKTRGYRTGGSIHIVINNQIGFTTSAPLDTRSTFYCTDVSKMIEAPIFHVNGNDPEAIYQVAQIAMDYRMRFKKDVVIDLVCFRLHGHNESDEPSATQPMMYKAVKQMKTPAQVYAEQLVSEGVLSQDEFKAMTKRYRNALEAGEPVVMDLIPAEENKKFIVDWAPYANQAWDMPVDTKVSRADLDKAAQQLVVVPEWVTPQKQVNKTLQDRVKMIHGEIPLNWGCAELLAYATLVSEGYSVRFTGEDVGRGTFAHRHAVLHDQATGQTYTPLEHIAPDQGRFEIIDSLLSEEAVMAFEYGYSSSEPNALTIWEAQFGDFANGAQVVIDQFISSGEEKWGRLCGLALFLPHGQEGMGAEHSSARLERFLQLCAHDNMQVCVPTTPAQHFHMIRRQMVRPLRKPLVVMTPKSLLRHPLVTSSLEELTDGHFHLAIDEIDKEVKAKNVTRVVLCQGKVYYDLLAKRRTEKQNHVAIVRIEQLYPFPEVVLRNILSQYAHVTDIVWCQEEPRNQGAWYMIQDPIRELLSGEQTLSYAGREAFAAPAVGYPALFHEQQAQLVADALQLHKKG